MPKEFSKVEKESILSAKMKKSIAKAIVEGNLKLRSSDQGKQKTIMIQDRLDRVFKKHDKRYMNMIKGSSKQSKHDNV